MAEQYGGYTLDEIAQAVAMVESSGGKNVKSRYEPGFQRRYLQGKQEWEKLAAKYGWQPVSSSHGKWQIMFPTAVELGFTGSPEQLADEATNRQYFEKKFQRDYKKTGDLRKTFLRYNGGGDPTYPDKVMRYLPKKEQQAMQGQKQQMSKAGSGSMEDRLFRMEQMVRGFERGMGMPEQGLSPQEMRQIVVAQQQGAGKPQRGQMPQMGGLVPQQGMIA